MANKKGKKLYIDEKGKSHYELDYAVNVINNNKNVCSGLRRQFKSSKKSLRKPHGISQVIWKRAMKSTKCPKG